jgi:F0F1-type ATP synthase membrane subunit c/vacuolar-type H+-ATPase subunit K
MRWRANRTEPVRGLVWVCLVLGVAAYGSVVVRNVTETLVGIATHQPSMVVVQRPSR